MLVDRLLLVAALPSAPTRCPTMRLSATPDGLPIPDGLPMPRSTEDWRGFRAALVAKKTRVSGEPAAITSAANAARLRHESPVLWDEYVASAWAHPLAVAEAGALLCACPLQSILMHQAAAGSEDHWPRMLLRLLEVEGDDALPGEGIEFGDGSPDGRGTRRLAGFGAVWRAATLICNRAFARLDRESLAGERGDLWRMQQRALKLRRQVRDCIFGMYV